MMRLRSGSLLAAMSMLAIGAIWSAPAHAACTPLTASGVPSATQNFDGLSSVVAANVPWADDSTVPGWFATRTAYNVATGSTNTGAMYSFGVAGVNAVTDRALGGAASGGTGTFFWAGCFVNNTGAALTSVTIAYTGEQWRDGGNAVPVAQTMAFQYQVANAGVITDADTPTTGWINTNATALDFTSPTFTITAGALDGNAAANRTVKNVNIPVAVATGQQVWIRWQDINDAGNDHGLAVDDVAVTGTGAAPAGETIYGITSGLTPNLVSFQSSAPGTVTTVGALTGALAGHAVKAIDFRPANGQLYALSTNVGTAFQLYTVNLATAALTPVGAPGNVATIFPKEVSIDFNPVVDRLRVVAENGRSYRIDPNTGALVLEDTAFAFAAGDPNFGDTPVPSDIAYDRNDTNPATPTTLFAYENFNNVLARVGSPDGTPTSPNSGLLTTIGFAGALATSTEVGFDISPAGNAYISLQSNPPGADRVDPDGFPGFEVFGQVNLATGSITFVGAFQAGINMLDIAAQVPVPALDADLTIVLTDSPDPVVAGTNLTYTATLTNNGPSDAQGANLTLTLPAGTSFVSATASGTGTCNAVSPVVCTWAGATAPGAANARTATVVASVPASSASGSSLNASVVAASSTPDSIPANNTATAGTGVIANANLAITLADSPDPVTAGSNVTYVANLSNLGPSDAQGANIALPLPATMTFVSAAASAGGACVGPAVGTNGTVTCTWTGPTAIGTVRTATVVATVPANTADGTVLLATATAASTTTDLTPGNNQAQTSTTVSAQADLSITLTDSPDPVTAGTQLTYTATLTNGGISDAQSVSISLPLPAGTSFVSATPSAGGVCNAASPVVCTWAGATAMGGIRSVTIVVLVAPSQLAALSATATAGSTTTDPNNANNTATATTNVATSADLSLTLTDALDPVTAGTNLTYTATISNAGPSDAIGVTVTLPLPAGTTFVSGSGATCAGSPVVCTVAGSIAPLATRVVTIVVAVSPAAVSGSVITATATVAASTPDPTPGNNSATTTTTVTTSADLVIALSTSATQAATNVPVTFTATSQNLGPSDAQNVSITLTLTPDFRFSSLTATGATCTTPQLGTTGTIVCTWAGATAPGVTRTLSVDAYSNSAGRISVSASTASSTPDPFPNNNAVSVAVVVGFQVEGIPSLNALGLLLLSLLLGTLGAIAVRRQD